MKAIVHDRYGAPETLELRDLPPPAIRSGEVLIRVRAASLHPGDVFALRGAPFPVRLATGLRRPSYGVPGLDLAGTVEAVSPGVTHLRPGDEAFGVGVGTCAELVRAKADQVITKPASVGFEEAAAIPTSALAALHGLRDAGDLHQGQHVLVNGASGGVGSYAVQIAKVLRAEVTGVCSASNIPLLRSLGADHVVDYAREDFTDGRRKYDVILDNVENRPLSAVRRALTPRGTLVLNSGTGATGLRMLGRLLWPLVLSPFTRHRLRRYLSNPRRDDLEWLAERVSEGSVRPVIGSIYPLPDTADALRLIEGGHARGKVVVAVSSAVT
jgi:NADPH:quinone reductase-like Zn-dependent oxidoreductase